MAGWKAAADPSDVKGRPRSEIRLVIPSKHGADVARSLPGSPFVAVADDNFSQEQNWFVGDMRAGGFKPVFIAKPIMEDAVISFGGEYLAGTVQGTGQAREVQLWSLKTGKLRHRFTAPLESNIWVVGFAAGGRLVGFQNKDAEPTLPVWDASTGAVTCTISPGKSEGNPEAHQFAVSPGGRYAAGVFNGELHVFSTADGSEAGDVPLPPMDAESVLGPRHTVKAIAFSPDGSELAVFCELGTRPTKNRIVAWDMASGQATGDCVMPQIPDARWGMRNDVKFEDLPDAKGWRFNREILDRCTGLSLYTVPPAKENQEGLEIKALDADHVFVVGQAEFGGGVPVGTVTLPRAQMAKAAAALQAGGKSIDGQLPPLTKGQWPANQQVPSTAAGAWALKPDLVKIPALGGNPIPMKSSAPSAKEQIRPTRIVFTGLPGNSAAISYHHGPDDQVRLTTVDRIPLAGGAPASFDLPGAADVMDLSADGSLFVLRTKEDRIDIYSAAPGAPGKPVVAFRPYEQLPGAAQAQSQSGPPDDQKVEFASLIDAGHLLTASRTGVIALWALPKCQGIWSMQTQSGTIPCLSPGRKQLAVSISGSTVFVDAASGKSLAVLGPMSSDGFLESAEISISPDGARFARYENGSNYLAVVDLASGQTLNECSISAGSSGIVWCGKFCLLLSGTTLVDLDLRQVIWSFAPVFCPSAGQPDLRFWCAAQDQRQGQMLTPFTLPHSEALKLIAGLHKDDITIVKPGVKVTLDVNILGDEARTKAVTQIMTQKLTEMGMVVAPDQPIHLQAVLTQTGSKQEKYRKGNQDETINIPQYESKILFVKDGQTIWGAPSRYRGVEPGMFVMVKAGRTLQQMVDEANARMGDGRFSGCRLPKYVAKPIQPPTVSIFTSNGLQTSNMKSHP